MGNGRNSFSGVILAGGKSSRMGFPKPFIRVNGKYRLTELDGDKQHSELVNTGEIPESAGAVTIGQYRILLTCDYSPSLRIGVKDHEKELADIFDAIKNGDYTIY